MLIYLTVNNVPIYGRHVLQINKITSVNVTRVVIRTIQIIDLAFVESMRRQVRNVRLRQALRRKCGFNYVPPVTPCTSARARTSDLYLAYLRRWKGKA